MAEDFKGERVERDLKTKKVYHYYDNELGINQSLEKSLRIQIKKFITQEVMKVETSMIN